MILCLDSNCVIYLVEHHPVWGPKVTARLAAARSAGDQTAVCDLARAECLCSPLAKGDAALLADYQQFFGSPAVNMLPVTATVCEKAAEVRVASGMRIKLPDALHLAAAIVHGCGLFLTNDVKLASCPSIPVEILT
jgi:predicted nucleic acid-binding protein